MVSQEYKLMKWCESHNIKSFPDKKRDHHLYNKNDKRKNKNRRKN